jgi:hypothetical protein
MRRLLIFSTLAALTSASLGCCGCGNWFSRRDYCPPAPCAEGYAPAPCNSCEGGAMAPGAVITAPPATITPGPAYSTGYLPR